MGWRSHISREAISGSLDTFPPGFSGAGIGTAETFSKLKRPVRLPHTALRPLTSSSKVRLQRIYTKAQALSTLAYGFARKPRVLLHGAVLCSVGLVVLGAQTGSVASRAEVLSRLSTNNAGYGSALDDMSAAGVAAQVAVGTSLLVGADASATASNLSSQVALATSDDGYLSKRQVVPTATTVRRETVTYAVKAGDTLSTIATQFNITSATIRWANSIADADSLKPGEVLSILPTSGLRYTVKAGDTAESIASQFQAVPAQILSFNDAEVKGLVAGQEIIVPDGVKAEPVAAAPAKVAAVSSYSGPTDFIRVASGFVGGNSYSYGHCTYYAKSRRPDVGSFWGNASSWFYNARANGFATSYSPSPGWIAWRSWGGGGAGHVAIVERVNGDGTMVVSDMNGIAGWNRVGTATVPISSYSGFIGY